jgi:metallo-beta-lactamase class B
MLLALSACAFAQPGGEEERRWNTPVEPFRIAGNLYYVGALEVTSYLVATPAGLIVLDSGFHETAPQVLANIEKLGFHTKDVKWLLISHPHYDHVGGIADLRDATGAKIAVSAADAEQVAKGGKGDFAFGNRFPYRPFHADRLLHDGERLELGGTALTANVTPGHTRGCTSWTMDVVEGGKPLHVGFLCSVSFPGYQLVDNEAYPQILADFRASLDRLEAMPVDIFLAAHGSFYGLVEKRAKLCGDPACRQRAEVNPFVDPAGWKAHLAEKRSQLDARVAEQTAAQKAAAPRPP